MATASALPGPGAASSGGAYSGSRKSAQRFEYSVHSTAGFVELAPSSFRAASWSDRFVAAKEFYNALAKVPGVAEVKWQAMKGAGGHFMEQNVLVHVQGAVGTPLVFELTRNNHLQVVGTAGRVFTVTACFANPPAHLLAQAWRILLEVCRGKELLPEHARNYARRAVARAGQRIPGDLLSTLQQGAGAGEGPGSASPGGALASSTGPPPPKRSRFASPQRGPGTASFAPRAGVVPTVTGAAASVYQFTRPVAPPVAAPKVAAASPAEVPEPAAGAPQRPGAASSAAALDAAGQPAEYSQEGVAVGEKSGVQSEEPAPGSAEDNG